MNECFIQLYYEFRILKHTLPNNKPCVVCINPDTNTQRIHGLSMITHAREAKKWTTSQKRTPYVMLKITGLYIIYLTALSELRILHVVQQVNDSKQQTVMNVQ
jgi:electron transfer flavoprotein alpha/beta subunit